MLNEVFSSISDVVTLAAALYIIMHSSEYGVKVVLISWLMAIASITWGVIPLWINDILYDFSYIFIAMYLVTNCKVFSFNKRRKLEEELKVKDIFSERPKNEI